MKTGQKCIVFFVCWTLISPSVWAEPQPQDGELAVADTLDDHEHFGVLLFSTAATHWRLPNSDC